MGLHPRGVTPPAATRGEMDGLDREGERDRNLRIQEAVNAILRLSLEPISLDEQLRQSLGLILSLPWLAVEAKGAAGTLILAHLFCQH
jgi:hypothetical protein